MAEAAAAPVAAPAKRGDLSHQLDAAIDAAVKDAFVPEAGTEAKAAESPRGADGKFVEAGENDKKPEAGEKKPDEAKEQSDEEKKAAQEAAPDEDDKRTAASIFAEAKRKLKKAERAEATLVERERGIVARENDLKQAADQYGALFKKMDADPYQTMLAYCEARGIDFHKLYSDLSYRVLGVSNPKAPEERSSKLEDKLASIEEKLTKSEQARERERILGEVSREVFATLSRHAEKFPLASKYEDKGELQQAAINLIARQNLNPEQALRRIEEELEFASWRSSKGAPSQGDGQAARPTQGPGDAGRRASVSHETITHSEASERSYGRRPKDFRELVDQAVRDL